MRKKLWLAFAVFSCSGDDATWQADYVAKLRECGVISKTGDWDGAPAENWRCITECVSDAKCSDVVEHECNEREERWSADLDRCFARCDYVYYSGEEFPCANGDATDAVYCDGDAQCKDGSDEKGCHASFVYECKDGERFPAYVRCDDERDCKDGSDELNCTDPSFVCDDGEELFFGDRCDGSEHCSDGSDEKNCAESLCAP